MSSKLPIGVATIERPLLILFILYVLIFLISCTPANLSKQVLKKTPEKTVSEKPVIDKSNASKIKKKEDKKKEDKKNEENKILDNVSLNKTIIALFAKDDDPVTTKQFLNTFELGIYNLGVKNINLQIKFFETDKDLKNIIENNLSPGQLFIGPIQSKYTKIINNYCNNDVLFFSFSSKSKLAKDCVYLLNFFPKNELSRLLFYLNEDAKVALLYPENEYGYLINSFIDDIIFESPASKA